MPAASFRHSVSPASDDHEHRVLEVWKRLRDAHGADVAYSISHAGLHIEGACRGERLNDEDRERLTATLQTAQVVALTDLPTGIGREEILRGFAAYADLLQFWNDGEADRKAWGDAAADAFAKARIFRNQCHSADLESQIADRAANRRAAVVAGLRMVGLELAPWAETPTPAPRKGTGR